MEQQTASSGGTQKPAISGGGKLKVFVSYSRRDSDFANELLTGLEIAGFEPFLDTHDIAPGEDWESRLGRLIESADTVVFVISPASVASSHCKWEMERTAALSKRLLPIVWRLVKESEIPKDLKRFNYVYFDKPHSFAPSLAALAEALRTDLGWVREHTRLLTRAQEWQSANRPENRLLAGSDIALAKKWLEQTGAAENLKPSELHRDFIQASEAAETLRLSAERKRADELQRAVWRSKRAMAGVLIFALCAVAAALFARYERQIAEAARTVAEDARALLAAKLAELDRSERALTAYIRQTAPKYSDEEINARIGEEAKKLILRYEIDGREGYQRRYSKPGVPGGDSGVTIGIGYDLGYYTTAEIASDWKELPAATIARLQTASSVKGDAAKALLEGLADIDIPFEIAERQFARTGLPKYARQTMIVFPGSISLPPDAFGALVSLVYNRGSSITGDRRDEMRAIRSLLILKDYKGVAEQMRQMKRLWQNSGVRALSTRRDAEAELFEKSIAGAAARRPAAAPAAPPAVPKNASSVPQ